MNVAEIASTPTEKYGVGQPVSRTEDPRLITGRGRYTDDINLESQAYGYVVRSQYAHGTINGIDVEAAKAVPGVLAIYTGADLDRAGYGSMPCALPLKSRDGSPLVVPPHRPFAVGRVRYVGDPIALVVAETPAAAKDGAEAVFADIDPLPAVTDIDAALAADSPTIWDEAPGNVALDWQGGDVEAVEKAFAEAAHVTKLSLVNNRAVVVPMEPRAAIAEYDSGSDRFTLHVGCQGVFGLRQSLANAIMKIEPERLRVRTYDVGGSFGMKAGAYPEYVALLHGARDLGRPIKWCDERTGSFLSDLHGRDSKVEAELALAEDGTFLATRVIGAANMGAYISNFGAMIPSANIVKNMPSVYRTPLIAVATKCVFTNTTPVTAYRGAGRPEANYFMERLVDAAARETGRDPIDLRRQNMIEPGQIPFTAASGQVYDSGDFTAILDKCVDMADWHGFAARRQASAKAGKLRGIGLASYLEVTAPPRPEMGGIRFEPDGTVSMITGTLDYGQGHASTFAQVMVDKLGIPFERFRLIQGDSDQLLAGGGTGGSRSAMASSAALLAAGNQVIENARQLAAHVLEAATTDIEFDKGRLRIVGTDRSISLLDLAERVRDADLPADLPPGLDAALVQDAPVSSFPNGSHICEVEVDPDTGAVEVVRYVVVDDFGTLINPMLVEGQVHGGVVQGIGQALMEHVAYNDDGQLVAGSFMDYAVPRADQVPSMGFASHPVPATTNPLGVKGCGEAGVTGALPAVMNALTDALAETGAAHIDMPATPERVLAALGKI